MPDCSRRYLSCVLAALLALPGSPALAGTVRRAVVPSLSPQVPAIAGPTALAPAAGVLTQLSLPAPLGAASPVATPLAAQASQATAVSAAARPAAALQTSLPAPLPAPAAGISAARARRAKGASGFPAASSRDRRGLEAEVLNHAAERGFVRGRVEETPLPQASGSPLALLRSSPAQNQEPEPGPPAPDSASPERREGRFFSPTVTGFLFSFFSGELWVEATAFAIPQFAKGISEGFLSMAVVAGASAAALGAGNLLGGPAVDRFGIRKVYVGMMFLRMAAAAGLAFLHQGLGLPMLASLFSAEYFFIGVSRVAESALPAALFGSSLAPLNRFGSWQLRILAAVGILGPVAVTALIAGYGFSAMLLAFAAVLGVGAVAAWLTLRAPQQKSDFNFRMVGQALRELRQNSLLRWAAWGAGLPLALVFFLYLIVGHAFGLYVAGAPAGAAAAMGWLVGLYSVGGFLGSWLSDWYTRHTESRLQRLTEVPKSQLDAAARRVFLWSTQRWLAAAGLALLGVWALALGAALAGPWPAYLAMALLGFAATGALVQSETLVRNEAPEGVRGTVIGLVRAATMFGTALGLAPLGLIFHYMSTTLGSVVLPATSAFLALGLAATLGSAQFLRIAQGIKPAPAAEEALPPAGSAPGALAPVVSVSESLTTLDALYKLRPLEEINREIEEISASVGWSRWMDVIKNHIFVDPEDVLLSVDAQGKVLGYLILDDKYVTDFGKRVVYSDTIYVAYMAARKDTQGRGIGKKLLLEAARRAKSSKERALVLHVAEGEPAYDFYQAMAKRIPIGSQTRDGAYVAGEDWIKIVFDLKEFK